MGDFVQSETAERQDELTTPDEPTMRERPERAAAFQDPNCKRINNRPIPGPMHSENRQTAEDIWTVEYDNHGNALIQHIRDGGK